MPLPIPFPIFEFVHFFPIDFRGIKERAWKLSITPATNERLKINPSYLQISVVRIRERTLLCRMRSDRATWRTVYVALCLLLFGAKLSIYEHGFTTFLVFCEGSGHFLFIFSCTGSKSPRKRWCMGRVKAILLAFLHSVLNEYLRFTLFRDGRGFPALRNEN